LLSFIPTALAQEKSDKPNLYMIQKPVACGDANEIYKDLRERWEEEPLTLLTEPAMLPDGRIIELPTVLFVNMEKKTYTIVQKPSLQPGQACVLSSGTISYVNDKIKLTLGGIKL